MTSQSIILFDGICNLCNAAVRFIIKRDKGNRFVFASLQSEKGKEILSGNNYPDDKMTSFILIQEGKIYESSTAVLKVFQKLKGPWPLLYGFIIIPKFIRDGVYWFIATHRYRWFGKRDECMIPTPELMAKFLR